MACAQGALARLYVEPGASPHTFDGSSESYEFLAERLVARRSWIRSNGIRGTRSMASERNRIGPTSVGGPILFNPDPAMLDLWLPRILGEAESTDVFAVAETLPSFGVLLDKVGNTFEYKDCVVSSAVLRGRANGGGGEPEPLQLQLNIVGKSRTSGTSAPSVTLSTASNAAPYIFEDGVVSIGGTNREVLDFTLTIDNRVRPRWVNSLSATALCPSDRIVAFTVTVPADSSHVAGGSSLLDPTIKAVTLTFTNGNMALAISLAGVQFDTEDPVVRGKTEITYQMSGIAGSVTTTKEIVVTSDSTA